MQATSVESSHFRLYLQEELARRCRVNGSYSLRAFAKALRVESSALSKVLNGKRSISPKMLERLCERLRLDPETTAKFRGSAIERRGRKNALPEISTPSQTYQQMAVDHFVIVSDWYHFAILELTHLDCFEGQIAWITKALGITRAQAKSAVERLIRVGFLRRDRDGWHDVAGSITNIKQGFTSSAVRNVQAQILEKSKMALEEVDIEKRDHTGMTMAIDEDLLPEAKKRIAKFRRELCAFLQGGAKKDSVYQLSLSLFPLTQIEKTNKSKPRRK